MIDTQKYEMVKNAWLIIGIGSRKLICEFMIFKFNSSYQFKRCLVASEYSRQFAREKRRSI